MEFIFHFVLLRLNTVGRMPKVKIYAQRFSKSRKFIRELNLLEIPETGNKISLNHKLYKVDKVFQTNGVTEIIVSKFKKSFRFPF